MSQRFDSPVGTLVERNSSKVWPGSWLDLTGFGRNTDSDYVKNWGVYHVGVDLNLPELADAGKPVYAAADGVVEDVVTASGWGTIIKLWHPDSQVWTRYAHLKDVRVFRGQQVPRGYHLAYIGEYGTPGPPQDHCHYDIPKVKMATTYWPNRNTSLAQQLKDVVAMFHDPYSWTMTHKEEEDMPKARVPYDRKMHILPAGAPLGRFQEVAAQAYPSRQTVGFSYDDGGVDIEGLQSREVFLWDIETGRDAFVNFYNVYYPGTKVSFLGKGPYTPPAPTPATGYKIGLNTLSNGPLALEEARRGCKYFLCMNDFGTAADIKRAYPDAIVMARRYFPQNFFLSPDQVIQGLEGAQHGPLVYIGFNEADQGGQDGPALRERARIDIQVARKIKEKNPGALFAAGTFSMGTPNFPSDETCQIIREEYAPHYNNGLIGLDMHLYSPNVQHIDQPTEHIWYERRWEFLFTKCGFDPNVRNIYCSETGLDEGGIGGFPAHGSTLESFRNWVVKNMALQNMPLTIGGKQYRSPIRGGAIFQLGGNGDPRWAGYNVWSYLSVLREYYNQ